MVRGKYKPRENYPHGFKHNSPEYGRMKYVCKVLNITYKEYCTNIDKYKDYRNTRKKHLQHEAYSYDYHKTIWLNKKYNITIEEYNEMLLKQNGVCSICGNPETTKHRVTGEINGLSVDHDHITGKVRGLLCNSCNRGLGYFKDNSEILNNAKDYLDKHKQL